MTKLRMNFYDKGDRIYRINQPMIWTNWDEQFASTGPNVAEALREDAPESNRSPVC